MYQYLVSYRKNGRSQAQFVLSEGQSIQWAVPDNGVIEVQAQYSSSAPAPVTPDYTYVLTRIADRLDRDAEMFRAAWEREPELPYYQAKVEVLTDELKRVREELHALQRGGTVTAAGS